MSVRATDSSHVALYDSVSGEPIEGLEIFGSLQDAEAFIEWWRANFKIDLRMAARSEVRRRRERWEQVRRQAEWPTPSG